jgi:hypothetical protein
MSRSTHPLRPFSLVALACAAALLVASCHGSDKKAAPTTKAKAAPTTAAEPGVSLAFKLAPLQVQSTDTARPFSTHTAKEILRLVNAYTARAVARPLFTGADSTGLVGYFLPSLASRVGAKGRDRAALTDEHTPVMTSGRKADKRKLVLVGLQTHGDIVMIAARFGLTVKGETEQGPLTVTRFGDLLFEKDARHRWRISGYSVLVRRDTKRASTTTTAEATTTTVAK